MAKKEKEVKLEPKGEGHTVYTFNRDYPLGGKKKGDPISLKKVPNHLKPYFDEFKDEVKAQTAPTGKKLIGEFPDVEKASKQEILNFLHNNGVPTSETNGLSKEDLFVLLGPFYQQ